jgi:hypothetical protein
MHLNPPHNLRAMDVERLLREVFADPHRLVDVLGSALSDADAMQALCDEFNLAAWQAQIVIDQRIRSLIKGNRIKRRPTQ